MTEEADQNKQTGEFYSGNMQDLVPLPAEAPVNEGPAIGVLDREDVNELDVLSQNIKEEPSLEILVDLAKQGDINPWDVDLEKVTSEYLKFISDNPAETLREAGKAIFYASVLLRMKSDILTAQSNEALNIGVHRELDDDALLEDELSEATRQITFNDLEAALRRKFIQKAKRFRKLTLKDLITSLQEARDEEEARTYRREQKRLMLDGYSIIAPELSGDILELTHAENLEACIERLQAILPEYLVNGESIEFVEIIKILGCWSNAFLATIFLAHENELNLEQEDFYGELWIHEPA